MILIEAAIILPGVKAGFPENADQTHRTLSLLLF